MCFTENDYNIVYYTHAYDVARFSRNRQVSSLERSFFFIYILLYFIHSDGRGLFKHTRSPRLFLANVNHPSASGVEISGLRLKVRMLISAKSNSSAYYKQCLIALNDLWKIRFYHTSYGGDFITNYIISAVAKYVFYYFYRFQS